MIVEAASKAEINHDEFWKIMKRLKGSSSKGVNAVKDHTGKARYELNQVLKVWRNHFDKLSTPKESNNFNSDHYKYVTESVKQWYSEADEDIFLREPFSTKDVEEAVKQLNSNKAPGYDRISSEHVKYGGPALVSLLRDLYNMCVSREYIPCNFRRGVQVPLYKGKNTCPLDPDNYRGITLLSTFNKLFEVLIWGRMKVWW